MLVIVDGGPGYSEVEKAASEGTSRAGELDSPGCATVSLEAIDASIRRVNGRGAACLHPADNNCRAVLGGIKLTSAPRVSWFLWNKTRLLPFTERNNMSVFPYAKARNAQIKKAEKKAAQLVLRTGEGNTACYHLRVIDTVGREQLCIHLCTQSKFSAK